MPTDREMYGSTRFAVGIWLLGLLVVASAVVTLVYLVDGEASGWLPGLVSFLLTGTLLVVTIWADRSGRRNPLAWLPSGRRKRTVDAGSDQSG